MCALLCRPVAHPVKAATASNAIIVRKRGLTIERRARRRLILALYLPRVRCSDLLGVTLDLPCVVRQDFSLNEG